MDTKTSIFKLGRKSINVRMAKTGQRVHIRSADVGAVLGAMVDHNSSRASRRSAVMTRRLKTTLQTGRQQQSHTLWVSEERVGVRLASTVGGGPEGFESWLRQECEDFRLGRRGRAL